MKVKHLALGFACVWACLVTLGIAAAIFLPGASGITSSYPPQSAIDAPIYPGATHIVSDTTSTVNVKMYGFQTTDKPIEVLDYYRETLAKDGWEEKEMPTDWQSHAADFILWDPDRKGFFELSVDAPVRATDGITHVTIKLLSQGSM